MVRKGPECRGILTYDGQAARDHKRGLVQYRVVSASAVPWFSLGLVALCDPGPWVPTTSTCRSRLRDRPKEAWGGSTPPRPRVLRFNRLGMGWFSVLHRVRPERVHPVNGKVDGLSMGRIRRHVSMGVRTCGCQALFTGIAGVKEDGESTGRT